MFKRSLKRWLWRLYDYLGHLILLNILWVIFLILSSLTASKALELSLKHQSWVGAGLCGVLIFMIPSVHVFMLHLCLLTGEIRVQKFSGLWRIYLASLLHGLPVFWIGNGGLLVILVNLFFYGIWFAGNPWLAWMVSGLFAGIFIFWTMTAFYSIPLYLAGKKGVLRVFRQSMLLVLDNPLYSLEVTLAGLFIISLGLVSIIGAVLLMLSAAALWQVYATRTLLDKYEENTEGDEPRSFRELFNPWKG